MPCIEDCRTGPFMQVQAGGALVEDGPLEALMSGRIVEAQNFTTDTGNKKQSKKFYGILQFFMLNNPTVQI